MRRKLTSRITLQLTLVLIILSLLWSSFFLVHDKNFSNLSQSDHHNSALESCLKEKGSNSETVHSNKEAPPPLGPVLEDDYIQHWLNGSEPHDLEALSEHAVTAYIREIMGVGNSTKWRLRCPQSIAPRYNSLREMTENDARIHYLFALDLHQSISVLPSLLGSIIRTIRFLGPENCAVSLVEGRSTDGTYQILAALRHQLSLLGATSYLSTTPLSPKDGQQDRIAALAYLRNLALAPLVTETAKFSPTAQIIFLNDIYLCPHDILELLLQQTTQRATMTCGMDWSHAGAIFYDIYVARSIVGETFWQIAQDGLWQFSGNLFWADRATRARYDRGLPFQVYACWNGGAVIAARPVMERRVRFRRNRAEEGECYMGEPTLFAKDLWRLGLGRIQVSPRVNVGYDEGTEEARDRHGRVEDGLNMTSAEVPEERVEWQDDPPSLVKCMEVFHQPFWARST